MQNTENAPKSKPLAGWTIVFDLDGTLVESAPDLLNALNHVVVPLGLEPVRLDDIRTMIGRGAKAMIREALSRAGRSVDEDGIDALWHPFIDHYRSNIAVDSHAFDGVETGLQTLLDAGAALSVCTNKTQALSDQLLDTINLFQYFKAVVGADSVPQKKPDAGHLLEAVTRAGGDPSRALLVGDSRTDEKAALNAGLPFIFVPFGYEPDAAKDMSCVAVLNHYSELFEVVLRVAS